MSQSHHPKPTPNSLSSEYNIDWTIQLDATSPIDAAREALCLLHDTHPCDPGGANVFTVTDAAGRIHSVDLGNLDNTATNTTITPVGRHGAVPALTREDAYLLLADEQARQQTSTLPTTLTVRLFVDTDTYVLAAGDHELLHAIAFDFGLPCDSSAEIVSVHDSLLGIDYTTDLADFLYE